MATEYQMNCLGQLKDWVNGDCHHSYTPGHGEECCPEFSCCYPDMFEQDRAKRVERYNQYAKQIGETPMLDA